MILNNISSEWNFCILFGVIILYLVLFDTKSSPSQDLDNMFSQNSLVSPDAYDEYVWPNDHTGDGGFFSVIAFKTPDVADKFREDYKFDDDHSVQIWSKVIIMALEKEDLQIILSSVADEFGGQVIIDECDVAYSLLLGSR